MKISRLLILPLLLLRGFAEDARVTKLVQQSDAEDRRHHPDTALVALKEAEAIEPRNAGVLVRISKQTTDLAAATKDAEKAQALMEKALDYGKRAVALDPTNAKAHLNLAVCYGKLTDFVGNKTKLEYSKLIREEAQKSIDLDPTDDFAWHVMGRWHAGISNVGAVMRTLAKVVYGGMPEASVADAERCLRKAAELAPQRIIHHAELAKVHEAMENDELAAKEWGAVLALPALDEEDRKYQREATGKVGK